jgi:outer membrane protein assembly factor BamE
MGTTTNRIMPRCAAACIVVGLLLASCSVFSVHRIDVRQGNALEPQAIEQLEVGMTEEQVRYLLGSPMISDSYHDNRWDYVYYYDPGDGPVKQRQMTVFFEDGQVVKIKRPHVTADG